MAARTPASSTSPRPVTSPRPASSPGVRLLELRLDSVDGYEVGQEIKVDTPRQGRPGRRHRRQPGQGLRRRHEASQLQRPGRQPRQPQAPPGAGLHRRLRRSRAGCSRAPAWPGRMGAEQVTTLNLEVVEADVERDLLLVKGSVPGPRGGVVDRPQRRQGRQAGEQVMASITVKTPSAPDKGTVELADELFGIQPNVPRDAPGRHRPAGPPPGRHPEHQDPRRGARRRSQAVPPEGHRQRPPGLDPCAALGRRRRRPRAQAPQLRPAHAQEDDQAGAALGPVRPRCRRARSSSSTSGAGTAPSTKAGKAALAALGARGPGAGGGRARTTTTPILSFRNLPEVQLIEVGELNAYDVLCNDWIVFTKATLPGPAAEAGTASRA